MPHNRQRAHLIGGDRNAKALRVHHHKQFVERVAQGLVAPHDRFDEPITVGDLLLWHPTIHPVGQVMALEPLPLEHQPPEGSIAVRIILAITAPVTAAVGRPMVYLTRKGHVEQAAEQPPPAGEGETPPVDSPAAPETPDDPTDPPA